MGLLRDLLCKISPPWAQGIGNPCKYSALPGEGAPSLVNLLSECDECGAARGNRFAPCASAPQSG